MEILKNVCRACSAGCGVNVLIENDKILKIEGNPDYPTNKGGLCARGVAAAGVIYAPDRILHPLKRVGIKGEGKWEQISWDEAIDTVAKRLLEIKSTYGPKSLAFMCGQQWHFGVANLLHDRFHSAVLGTPNWGGHGHMCSGPNSAANAMVYGESNGARPALLGHIDYPDYPCKCMVLWGANPFTSRSARSDKILDWKEHGAKFIVIDPYLSSAAQKADIWLQNKPDTDVPLALSMANVIIAEGLYDKDFVEKWVYGFDKFKDYTEQYHPKKAEIITDVPAEKTYIAAASGLVLVSLTYRRSILI